MEKRKKKFIGIAVLLIAFFLGAFNSLAITNASVLDSDPSTYVIVTMTMIFLFIIFSMKEDIKFEYSTKNLANGAALFIGYLLLVSFSRVNLSFVFQTFRVDAFLLSILLMSFMIMIFGFDGAKRLKHILFYAIFASPILLMPILSQNQAFANFNASLVYSFLQFLGLQVAKAGLVISSATSSVTISTTCVSLGTFIAMIMFLVPLAYLYEGKRLRKVVWLANAFVLMLVLNIARMLLISMIWVYSGINSALYVFHIFIGPLLFYIVIIVMVLLAYRYKLYVKEIPDGAFADLKKLTLRGNKILLRAIVPAIFFGTVALLFSLQYSNAINAPVTYFNQYSVSNTSVAFAVMRSLGSDPKTVLSLGQGQAGLIFSLLNLTQGPNGTVYLITTPFINPTTGGTVAKFDSVISAHSYVLKNGVTLTAAFVRSGNYTFDINYFSMPYNINGQDISVNYEMFKLLNTSMSNAPSCSLINYNTIGLQNYLQSAIYNIFRLQFDFSTRGFLCDSYYVIMAHNST